VETGSLSISGTKRLPGSDQVNGRGLRTPANQGLGRWRDQRRIRLMQHQSDAAEALGTNSRSGDHMDGEAGKEQVWRAADGSAEWGASAALSGWWSRGVGRGRWDGGRQRSRSGDAGWPTGWAHGWGGKGTLALDQRSDEGSQLEFTGEDPETESDRQGEQNGMGAAWTTETSRWGSDCRWVGCMLLIVQRERWPEPRDHPSVWSWYGMWC